ncbi:hypothetical protein FOC4_g10006365 [Fusarium odoratissimum]|uniref:Uncharacterized protein n=1 Tax=Fusarium oxysporum f. sp. cubense (strain race 4) TaxID=2502994 RepID=N1REC7_FUSC4|nr:hypothetical protein FOC4_g10006365 [Fusarium odoratissimum]
MEFQLAADYLHNTFTLGEKQLAKDLSESFYLDELPRTVYIRRPFVQLAEVLNEAQVYVQTHTKEDLRRLVLYCDTINLTEGLVIGYKDSEKPFGLQVFARKVECQNASQALHMHFSEDCQLEFYTYELKERKVFNVPSVNIYASKQVLESRLAASTAFEQAFQNFAAQERTSAAVLGQTVNLIAKSEDAMSEYAFLEDLAQKAYSSAQSARGVAFKRYDQNNTDLVPLQKEFSKGLEDWCTEQKIEAAKAVFSACISTIGAVTATVASGGLAAPMIAGAAGKATYLQTQENLCQRGNELAIILLKVKLQHKEKNRLTLSAKATEQQGAVLDLLKRAMFDRLLSIRSLVFLDFYMYSEAYMFHALTDKPPVNISPVKPVLDYLEDAAKFQGNVAAFGSRVMVQQRKFSILTCGDAASTSSLRDRLLKNESVFVSLDPKDAMFAGFSRIRVSKARCYLEGVSVAPSFYATGDNASIRLLLKTSGRFYDISLPGRKDGAAPFNAFVGDARALLFEYSVEDRSIICDGDYGQNLDYTRQSPLTEWELTVGVGGLQAKDLDFTHLKGIRMEFWCDITLKI